MTNKQKKKVRIQCGQQNPFSGRNIPALLLDNLGECYIVGGAVRDACLGRKFADLDITLAPCSDLKKRIRRLAKELDASPFEMDSENQVWRISGPKDCPFQFDIMPFQGGDFESDMRRRDFTVNALAVRVNAKTRLSYNPNDNLFSLKTGKKELIDLCGGLRDLSDLKIRAVSDNVFRDDPLRLLRAYRIAAEHGMKISRRTLSQIRRDSSLIKNAAGERIREELLKLLDRDDSCKWIRQIHASGMLFAIFPELAAQPSCATDYYGEGGVLRHTFAVLDRTDVFFARIQDFCPDYEKIERHLSVHRNGLYKFIALMHDIAKPAKATFIDGRLRFFGHEECGALMTQQIMERLHFSKDETRLACTVIGAHLRPGNLAINEVVSERAMFRLFRAMGNATIPLLVLCWADYASYITPARLEKFRPELSKEPPEEDITVFPYNSPKKTLRFLQTIYAIARCYLKKEASLNQKTYADGNDVIRILGIEPGPEVGRTLEQMRLLQFKGRINDRQQALDWLECQREKTVKKGKK